MLKEADLIEEWKKQDPFLLDAEGLQRFLDERIPKVLKEEEKEAKHKWELFFSMWERPVVYDQLGAAWADTVPGWLKSQILIERLIQVIKGEEGRATDAEVVAHLYTASLSRPLDRDWTEIYCKLATDVMKRARQGRNYEQIEKELGIRELTEYQVGLLNELKRDLWDAGIRASKDRRRERRGRVKNLYP